MTTKEFKWSGVDVALFFTLIFLFVVICTLNMGALLPNLHSDIVAEMNYTQEVVRQDTIFPVGWKHSQELFIIRPIFISAPIYAFTGNFVLSYQITLIIMVVLLILSIVFVLYKYRISFKGSLLTLCILFGLFTGYEDNAMWTFLYSYSVFPVAIFLSLGLLKDLYLESNKVKKICKYVLLFIIAFYTGVSGPRMMLVFYIPILIASLFMEVEFKKPINKNSEWCKKIFSPSILLVANIVGYFFLKLYLAQAIGFTDSNAYMVLGIKELFTNIISQISAIFMMLGVRGGVSLLSIAGADFIVRLLLICLVSIIGIYLLRNKNINKDHKFILVYMCSSIVFVFFYLLLTVDISVGRYYFMVIFLFAFVIGIYFSNMEIKCNKLFTKIVLLLLAVGIYLNASVYIFPKFENNRNEMHFKMTNYLESNGYDKIYASYWNASILKGLSNGKIETGHFTQFPVPFLWLIQENIFFANTVDEKSLVILSDSEEQTVLLSNGKEKSILETGEKIQEIGNLNLYEFPYNPIVNFKMPEENSESIVYDVRSNYAYVNNQCMVKQDASALQMSLNGAVMYGPYINIQDGNYDFYLVYSVVKKNSEFDEVGEFFITSQMGQKIITQEKLVSGKSNILIKNVSFSEEKDVEFKIVVYGENIIDIKSIVITKNK